MKEIYEIPTDEYKLFLPVLKSIDSVAGKYGFQYVLIGALARDILIKNVYNCELQFRATLDIDFAVMVENWDSFNMIIEELVINHNFAKDKRPHRLYRNSIIVDIIPFGNISSSNSIFWQPGSEIVINVIGFKEVYDNAVIAKINSIKFKVTCLEGFAVLKLIAWSDRNVTTKKDAEDLGIIFYHYNEFYPDELFQEYSYLIGEPQYDYILAGIIIFGKKIRRFVAHSNELKTQISSILHYELADPENSQLALHLSKIEKYEFNYKILKTFQETVDSDL